MFEKDVNKEEADCFVDLVTVLGSSGARFNMPKKLAKVIGKLMNRFISNEGFCERCTNLVLSSMNETEGKTTQGPLKIRQFA